MIGNKLKEQRKQKQITQNDLAHLLGTNVKSIRNWEDDISDPNLQSFCKILKVFHISANEMLSMLPPDTIDLSSLSERGKTLSRSLIQTVVDSELSAE